VRLSAVIVEALRRIEGQAKAQGVSTHVRSDAELPSVLADPLRVRAVFDNIFSNALKYMPNGGSIVIESRAIQSHGSDDVLSISIVDTGPGIPTQFRSRIFDKFFRLEHHQTEGQAGTRGAGIGLYMCREIVELHGGQIACDAGFDGRGTRITVTLPSRAGASFAVRDAAVYNR